MKQGSVDIHAGLRLYTDRDKEGRILAKFQAESGVDVQAELQREINRLSARLAFLQSWKARYEAQGSFAVGRL